MPRRDSLSVCRSRGTSTFATCPSRPSAAKEIRVFGLLGWLQDKWRDANGAWFVQSTRARRGFLLWPLFWFTIVALAISMAAFAVIGRVGAEGGGSLDVTKFSIVITAALGALALGHVYPESDVATAVGMHAHQSVTEFLVEARRVSAASAGKSEPLADRAPVSTSAGSGIAFDGAGKTTLVKLLTRLYEPTSGPSVSTIGTSVPSP